MSSDRLRRFLKLERPRTERDQGADHTAASATRFDGLERPGSAPAPTTSGARLDRFGPEPEGSIELAETSAEARPFTRCMRCGADHNVSALECAQCGASLDTAEQREFNERLWAARQEETAREARADAEREKLRAEAVQDLDRRRRAMGEEIAREVGELERRRLGGWGDEPGNEPPLAWRLLGRFSDPHRRTAVAIASASVLVLLAAVGLLRGARPALYVAAALAVLLFVPPRRRRRWWW